MTTTATVTLPANQDARPCPCGCAPCPDTCCNLDCLVQPRFFCGQLLTDDDLARLVSWTRGKLRLTRYRHGWGVVCGLEVRCDPRQPGGVIVGPGYAVSCCGEDVVVCEDTPVDLSAACQEEADPCADLRPARSAERPSEGGYGRGGALDPFHPDGGDDGELAMVDLAIGYRTELAAPVTALTAGACNGATTCDYAQLKETFELTVQQVPADADPVQVAADAWLNGYKACTEVLTAFGRRFTSLEGNGEAIRRWLVRWIDDHPLHQFCFVRDRICRLDAERLTDEPTLVRALFWLVQDCRNAYLACACHACGEGHRVPLARVWLRRSTAVDWNGSSCSVVQIDGKAPYRRPLAQQCWPAPLGAVNGGQVLWHRWPDACTTLAGLGVQAADPVELTLPGTLVQLKTALDCSPFLDCDGGPVVPQYLDVAPYGQRVVGFCGTAPTRVPAPGREPAPEREADRERRPGVDAEPIPEAVPEADRERRPGVDAEPIPEAEPEPEAEAPRRRTTRQTRSTRSSRTSTTRGGTRRNRRDG